MTFAVASGVANHGPNGLCKSAQNLRVRKSAAWVRRVVAAATDPARRAVGGDSATWCRRLVRFRHNLDGGVDTLRSHRGRERRMTAQEQLVQWRTSRQDPADSPFGGEASTLVQWRTNVQDPDRAPFAGEVAQATSSSGSTTPFGGLGAGAEVVRATECRDPDTPPFGGPDKNQARYERQAKTVLKDPQRRQAAA